MSTKPDLAQVSIVYIKAAEAGQHPTKSVAKEFKISQATAGRWVTKARTAELIPSVRPGVSPRLYPRALEVAAALGIDYDALVAAVLEHADGRLIVQKKNAG